MEQLFGINPPSRLLLRDASGPGSKSSKDHVEQLKPSRVLCYAYIVSQQFIRKGKELCAVDRFCLEGVRSNKKEFTLWLDNRAVELIGHWLHHV